MVPSRTGPVRSRIRQPRRREPDPGLVWKHRPPPDQPRRRPPVEPRPTHGRGNPHAHGPRHTRLRRETNRRRTHPPRDPPLPQALPCPPDLPPPQRRLRHPPGGLTKHRRFNLIIEKVRRLAHGFKDFGWRLAVRMVFVRSCLASLFALVAGESQVSGAALISSLPDPMYHRP